MTDALQLNAADHHTIVTIVVGESIVEFLVSFGGVPRGVDDPLVATCIAPLGRKNQWDRGKMMENYLVPSSTWCK